ncbi:MAG: RNA polymerase sigma factor [Sandaracinus sp.]|nr:RNA polymerase sigma factor [Myxococcales bacterium]MCB9601514.1 RNA polymerase sigma factor [Sandaracinus sp.]MCB9612028.1 RNA polymerase sigma factor [Sandaracinus sp.]MCB9635581.1 RNA polymerase sigma factor [Sandaracinus sp.]
MTASTPAPDELEGLAARAATGDRRAAEQLLHRLLPRVRNLVRYLVRGDTHVDDMAQNALLAILRGLPGYRGEGAFKAWADRITVRETLAYAKRERARFAATREAAPDLHVVREEGQRTDVYVKRRDVARLLDTLPTEQREVLVLHHVMGMSVPELAENLGVPFDTAKSRLRLATKKLRETLEARRTPSGSFPLGLEEGS